MKKIIQERILKTEEQPLSETDRTNLILKRNKQLIYLLSAYVPLALILAYVFLNGLSVIYREKYPYPKHEITDEDITNFALVAPYVCGFFFLLLTFFFIRYYLQTAAPLIKDIRKNKKHLLHIKPEKTEMAFFNRYYISTPIRIKQQVQIDKDDFHSINDSNPLILELAPYSQSILRLVSNGKEIRYY
jgi:hypothetical protein